MDEKLCKATLPFESFRDALIRVDNLENVTPLENFRDARIRLGLWAKENLCSCGAQPDFTREAGLEGLLEFQKRFYDVLATALKARMQIAIQRALPTDFQNEARLKRINEIHDKGITASAEEKLEMLELLEQLKKDAFGSQGLNERGHFDPPRLNR